MTIRRFAGSLATATLTVTLAACGGGSKSTGGASVAESSASSSSQASASDSYSAAPDNSSTASTTQAPPASSTSSEASASTTSATAPVTTVAPKPSTLTPAAKTSSTSSVPVNSATVDSSLGGAKTGAKVSSQALTPTVSGLTMTFDYTSAGQQHLYRALPEGDVVASPNSAALSIDFGDGSLADGADLGSMECLPNSALAPFNDKLTGRTHTYAKPGTYTVTTKVTICGDAGAQEETKTFAVTVK